MNKKTNLIILLSTVLLSFGMVKDKPAYIIYNKKGKKVKYKKMIAKLKDADIIFIGELHNNPISHWMELEITKDIYAKKKKKNMILGAEMFEADNQLIIDEYLDGIISEKKFEAEVRLWDNYKTDYKPLINFAKENKLHFTASNIPRRYASLVFKKGTEGLKDLTPEAKKYIVPLPFEYDSNLKCYADMIEMGKQMGHTGDNFPKSQAIKDATMAHFILKSYTDESVYVHYNGAYHSDNFEGIVWYIKQANPKLKIATISTVSQKDIDELDEESKGKADFIITVPETMTKTY